MKTIDKKLRRKIRVRSKVRGTKDIPRLSIFRSNRYIYAQLIDDGNGKTLVAASEKNLDKTVSLNKVEKAKVLGIFLAKKALSKKIEKVVFDRGSYAYHGRVSAVAKGARKGGLKF